MDILLDRDLFEDRFWASVTKTDTCWLWHRQKVGTMGYGQFSFRHKNYRAHRLSYCMANGPIAKGLLVRHTCHVPSCVRPSHLLLGTFQDNVDDAVKAGRHSKGQAHAVVMKARNLRGEAHFRTKLTAQMVLDIRAQRAKNVSLKQIAAQYGIAPVTVSAIAHRRTWGHV